MSILVITTCVCLGIFGWALADAAKDNAKRYQRAESLSGEIRAHKNPAIICRHLEFGDISVAELGLMFSMDDPVYQLSLKLYLDKQEAQRQQQRMEVK